MKDGRVLSYRVCPLRILFLDYEHILRFWPNVLWAS